MSLPGILMALWGVAELVLIARRGGDASQGTDRSTFFWTVVIIVVTLLLAVVAIANDVMPLPKTPELQVVSCLVLLAGVGLRFTAVSQLKRFFTVRVTLQPDHRLIQTGLYRYLRHPSYTGGLLALLGGGLGSGSLAALLLLTVPLFFMLRRRMAVEEAALEAHFGEEFLRWKSSTSRLIPGIY
jgi:protein-S-isoprenylcysteine O-methyltransferase Ste14